MQKKKGRQRHDGLMCGIQPCNNNPCVLVCSVQCTGDKSTAEYDSHIPRLQPGLEADSMTNKDIMPEQDANA